jgi:hypothetical protein
MAAKWPIADRAGDMEKEKQIEEAKAKLAEKQGSKKS